MSTVDIRLLLLEQYEQALQRAWQKGDVEAAHAAAMALLKVRQETLGAYHPEVANALYEVAETLRQKRDLKAAHDTLTEALAIEEKAYGREHERYGEALTRLGEVQLAQGEDARATLGEAASILERSLGDDTRVAMALTAEAAATHVAGDLERSAKLLERSLQILAVAQGPENEAMATPLEALSVIEQARGNWEDALSMRRRIVRILERAKSPALPHALQKLAQLALDAGELDMAEEAAANAVRIHASPTAQRAHALETLGEVMERQGRLVQAREQYRAAFDLYSQTLDAHHPQLGVAAMNVATVELRLGEVERATQLAEHSLHVFLDAFGPTHPHTRALCEALQRTFASAGHEAAWHTVARAIQVPA